MRSRSTRARLGVALLVACACRSGASAADGDAEGSTSAATIGDTDTATSGGTGTGGEPLPPRPDHVGCRFEGDAPGLLPAIVIEPAYGDETAAVIDLARVAAIDRVYLARADLRIDALPTGGGAPTAVIDLGGRAQRLVALAASPNHAADGHLFVRFEAASGAPRTVISRFTVDGDTAIADPASERVVIELDDVTGDSSGGALAFGPDGLLYIGVGDADDAADSQARDTTVRAGKILRIDVAPLDDTGSYGIPADNPFVGDGGRSDEVWARGLRDPWRCVFDGIDPRPWCVDRGVQEQEIDHVDAGADLGWPLLDGGVCLLPGGDCSDLGSAPPSAGYRNVDGDCGVAGVVLVRDAEHPELDGALIYADRCSGRVRGLDTDAHETLILDEILGVTDDPPTAVAPDADGSVLLLGAAAIQRVVVPPPTATFPLELSASGCFDDLQSLTPAAGVVPYDINSPLWTDGAIKQRFIVLPDDERITIDADGVLDFPVGTVLLKTFTFEFTVGVPSSRRTVETRVMVRRPFAWQFHSYRWNDAGTDAALLTAGFTDALVIEDGTSSETFDYAWPSRASCKVCHGLGSSRPLGPRIDQLDRVHDYGHVSADQLAALAGVGMFDGPVPDGIAAMAAPDDDEADLEARARAYLHGNCGHCHRPGGWTPPDLTMDLRYATSLADTHICNVETQYYDAWVDGALRVAPGDADASVIWQRLHRRGIGQMPPLATALPDPHAIVVHEWIDSLTSCP